MVKIINKTILVLYFIFIFFTGIVFLLWGNNARIKEQLIDGSKHHILSAAHPSPYSANNGFFGCRHFSKTNEILTRQKQEPINWKLPEMF